MPHTPPPLAGRASTRRGFVTTAAASAVGIAAGTVRADGGHPLVETSEGDLPLALSVPHDGDRDLPDGAPRTGRGLERGPGAFVTARDTGCAPLAILVAGEIRRLTGRSASLVVCRARRTFVDCNRPLEEGCEDEPARRVHRAYHGFLARVCDAMRGTHNGGLVIDVHGQGSRADTVFRGTREGTTVEHLRRRFGEDAVTGASCLLARLSRDGFTVHPVPFDAREQPGFTGGFIVRSFGATGLHGTDGVQLEFGADYRRKENRERTARVLAAALVGELRRLLPDLPG